MTPRPHSRKKEGTESGSEEFTSGGCDKSEEQVKKPFKIEEEHSEDTEDSDDTDSDDDSAPLEIKSVEEVGIDEAPSWNPNIQQKDHLDLGKPVLRRLLHWGPLIALFIIVFCGLTSAYLSVYWWPIDTIGGFVHLSIFLFWNYSTISNLCTASRIGGGYVPKQWVPSKENAIFRLQHCSVCDGYKPPRAHHCSKCGRCVMKMDHHCPWINNCVGHRNHAYFCRFLGSAIIGCVHATIIIGFSAYHAIHMSWYLKYGDGSEPIIPLTLYTLLVSIGAFTFAAGVAVALTVLLFIQLKYVKNNKNGIEEYIVQKAEHRMSDEGKRGVLFVYPYNLGWKRNFREVLGSWSGQTVGNGVWWPVRKDCTQFTFSVSSRWVTEEQIRLKKLKEAHARQVEITRDFKGGVFGSLSHGLAVFFCQTCSDEPRVPVTIGEKWIVTRGNKRWLYGYKRDGRDMQVKGWFPRHCAVLISEDNEKKDN